MKKGKSNHERLYRIIEITTKAKIKFLELPPDIHEDMIITYCFDAGQFKKNSVKRVQILFMKYQYHILCYQYQPKCSSTVYIIIFSFKMSYIKCKYILVHLKQLPLIPFFFPTRKLFLCLTKSQWNLPQTIQVETTVRCTAT